MDKKQKSKLIGFGMIAALLALLIFTVGSTAFAVINAVINVSEHYFDVTDNGITYRCHVMNGDGNNVAIGYGADASSSSSTNITVPSTVTNPDSGTTYTVKAVNTAGFRYCNFTNIKLPQTVEEIGEEAFAYCQNRTTFDFPHAIDKIAPSTFLDCIALQSIYYTDASDNRIFGNNVITEIGDHAFDSCRALRSFYSPKTTVYYGESCFQRCEQLVNFFFPSKIVENNVIQNYITVRPYAFADCTNLVFIYFETNMKEIDNYAFVDCNTSLRIKYTGTNTPSFKRMVDGSNVNQTHWRDKYISTNQTGLIPIDRSQPEMLVDDDYPCLRYTIANSEVYLDSAKDRTPTVELIGTTEAQSGYAVIHKFDTPANDVPGCFTVSNGALIIPNTLNGKTVKVIKESTFANNLDIQSVTFNQGLVQICNKAFYGCLNIEALDFSLCQNLKEVSYFCFQNGANNMQNTKLTSLVLPDCLEYVGDYSFSNFVVCNALVLPSNLKAIADLAFYGLGKNIAKEDAAIDLVLPKSLSDANAEAANFNHQKSPNGYEHKDYTRWYAIGKYSFNFANGIRTIKMEADPDNATNYTTEHTCSIYSNAFKDCTSLLRFEASQNLQYLGKDAFKGCTALREVMLTTDKSNHASSNYPWCINEEDGSYGGTLFFGASPELVVYLDGASAPGLLESWSQPADTVDSHQLGHKWNAESNTCYTNEWKDIKGVNISGTGMSYANRSHVPTFYGVDLTNGIKYWNPDTKAIAPKPFSLEDYENGVISLAKGSDNKYSVARYWCDIASDVDNAKGVGLIDLTQIPGISDGSTNDLAHIGDEAFARSETLSGSNSTKKRAPGSYFVLPNTITTIGERAFYRRTTNAAEANVRFGARIITYKKANGKLVNKDGTEMDNMTAAMTAAETGTEKTRCGFCALPGTVTSIGKLAFYNHIFKEIILSDALTFIGHGAFFDNIKDANDARVTSTSITLGTNSNFKVANGGIYYQGGGTSKQILMYQNANVNTTLTLDSDTKAIGMQGCSNTLYTSITFPTTLTTIYGGGMTRNTKLTSVDGTSGLRYIGSMENATGIDNGWSDDGYTEIWDSSVDAHFDNTDYRDYAYDKRAIIEGLYGAFAKCSKLQTINFKQMTELRKIGWGAFQDCSSMKYMTGSDKYTFKTYKASDDTFTTKSDGNDTNQGVLDLQTCTKLRSINREAFNNCNSMKYMILPNNRGSASESTLYLGQDLEAPYFGGSNAAIIASNKSINVLVSETAFYANSDFGKDNHAGTHYPSTVFGTGNLVYYYAATSSDVPTDDHTGLKYWTKLGTDYILIGSADDARTYFTHH